MDLWQHMLCMALHMPMMHHNILYKYKKVSEKSTIKTLRLKNLQAVAADVEELSNIAITVVKDKNQVRRQNTKRKMDSKEERKMIKSQKYAGRRGKEGSRKDDLKSMRCGAASIDMLMMQWLRVFNEKGKGTQCKVNITLC